MQETGGTGPSRIGVFGSGVRTIERSGSLRLRTLNPKALNNAFRLLSVLPCKTDTKLRGTGSEPTWLCNWMTGFRVYGLGAFAMVLVTLKPTENGDTNPKCQNLAS